MVTQNTGGSRYTTLLCALLLMAASLLLIGVGCSSASHTNTPASNKPAATQQGKIYGPVAATPTLPSTALHGPTNFVLRTPLTFSDASGNAKNGGGTVTPLSPSTVQTGVTLEVKRLLFTVDSQDAVTVYSASSATPIKAQVTQRSDGGTNIVYTQTINSDGSSIIISFEGAIINNRIIVKYEQQYSPLLISNADATDATVTFTTSVQWIAADQLAAAPKNGHYQFAGSTGINLAWSPSQHAASYNVYRLISGVDQQYQLVGNTKDASYSDKSARAMQFIYTEPGISYAIFAVGSNGVENPNNTVIPVPIQKRE